jgi:hypothetical protein
MKKLLVLVCLMSLVWSCSKDNSVSTPNVDMKLAVRRLVSVSEWRVSDILVEKKLVFANGKPLDGKKIIQISKNSSIEFESILEKAIFGEDGKGKAKYADQTDFEDFNYQIDEVKQLLIIKNPDQDELYKISGGSIQSNQFVIDWYDEGVLVQIFFKSN